ncbi:MAG TPA: helix-turn-helix domain-containing protein [Firmicutes bacterium]|nr:helix-turn-helix domain-containing protein [Bacillota bacterium]
MKEEYKIYYLRIGARIKHYRTKAHLTQQQLAERIGKSATYIGHLEAQGVCKVPSLDTLLDISRVLQVPLHFLTHVEE